ncbi:MAG: RNA polymerase sigma factor [Janthinobacterium lividum]
MLDDVEATVAQQEVRTSFDEQFDELLSLAYRVAYRILGEREEAHDIAGETLARAYSRWDKLEDDAHPWVATVAGRAAIDVVRRRTSARRFLLRAVPEQNRVEQPELRLDLQRALLSLPVRQREVVVLRHLADRSEQETARALGLSPGTVKSHSSRGLAALRAALTPSTGSY